jgi:nicotinamidase-related amidase
MVNMRTLLRGVATTVVALVFVLAVQPSWAGDIVNDWDTVKAPPRPELKPVTLNTSTTALLILDMAEHGSCSRRPRCVATVPNVKRLYDAARAAGVMMWFSTSPQQKLIVPGVQERNGEGMDIRGGDKFIGSNLEAKLKAGDIKTVVVCGTSFQGVGVGTGTIAAQLGYKVVIPVDCLSAGNAYMEQASAWYFYKGGPVYAVKNSTLTRSTMVKFVK